MSQVMGADVAVASTGRRVDRLFDGTTLWVRWDADTGPDLVRRFAALTHGHRRTRLVLCPSSPDLLDATGRAAATALAGGRGDAVFVSATPPRHADTSTGRHCVLGPGLDAPPGVTAADLPPNALAFEHLLRSHEEDPGPAALAAGRVVAVHFVGGLGNQFFQYAAARSIADRTGAALVADLRWFPRQSRNVWELDAHHTRIDAHVRVDEDWARWGVGALEHRPEKGFTHDAEVHELGPGTLLSGYYQSPAYFLDNETAIRADLQLATPMSPWAARTAARLHELDRPVSLHVRRGDYLVPQVAQVHGSCSSAYYDRGLALLTDLVGGLDVAVFSDDPQWAQENVQPRRTRSAWTLHPPEDSTAPENLHLLSLARHAVLANSSFSWWGAWLRTRPGTVIAPRPWFAAATDTRDLLPAEWLTLDAR